MTFKEPKKSQSMLSLKLLWLLIPIFILTAVIVPSSHQEWTGFKKGAEKESLKMTESFPTQKKTSDINVTKITTTYKIAPAKTLWDWMSLLLAPATLAGLGFAFQSSQEKYKQAREQVDKDRVADQQREASLQSYFDNLSDYLVEKRLLEIKGSTGKADLLIDKEAALNVIRAKTLSLIRLFKDDIPRKASVLSFLGDAKLLPELKLDLSGSHWKNAFFRKANLSKAILSEADLSGAKLGGSLLREAILREADLREADLGGADLSGANLIGANLRGANLKGANLRGANLKGAKLSGAKLSDQQIKLACDWEHAFYVEDKSENDEKVQALKQDTSSDPEQCPDCSRWELKP